MPLKVYRRGRVFHYRGTIAGQRLRGTTGLETREAAEEFASKIEAKAWKCRTDGPAAVLTFEDAVQHYLAAEKTNRFLQLPRAYFKDVLVKDITAGLIKQAAIEIYPKAAAPTRNRQVIVPVQAVINHCADLGLCSPVRVKRFEVEKKEKTPVTVEWVRAFAKHAPPHLAALALFMFGTGARISEALRLRWSDVDLQAGTVLIGQRKQKTERLARLQPEVIAAMANLDRIPGRGPFFYLNRSAGIKAWLTACKRAGLPPLSFHACRHGFATSLIRAGVDVPTVAKRGGWKSARLVFETYGHASEDVSVVDKLFESGTKVTQRKRRL
ncbi:tyrosine-type recombinase/integrase [Bradyrhizobium oligotrophicum]|uniref:tyrosine-type recombinase/integrase n=1 Tax=Bradyrhizobium oligotrophicum TaxID=44255 RepID=UPI003EB99324